jgi:hypothetical protein
MAKIFFSSDSHKTCQYYREWRADYLSSRTKFFFLTGRSPFFTKRVKKVDFTSEMGCHAKHAIHESPLFPKKIYGIILLVYIEIFKKI